MTRLFLLTVFAVALVGCGSDKLDVTNNPPTPPPTQEQLANMPPEAAAQVSKMQEYQKAQAEQNKQRATQAPPK